MDWRLRVVTMCVAATLARAVCAQAPQNDVTVRAWLDRTAIWVADRATYTIEFTCRRGVEVLPDDVSRDKLKLEGLEVVSDTIERESASDNTSVSRFRYVLTTYRVDVPTLVIAPLTVRYAVRRSGQRLEDAALAGEVTVPGAVIAFRSVLPDGQDPSGVRSDKPAPIRPARFTVLQSVGIGLLIVSAIPVLLAVAALRRHRPPRHRKSVRAVRRDERVSLDALRAMDIDAIDRRREACAQLDSLVRDHLRDVCGIPGASLTPGEAAAALAGADAKVRADLVASVLGTCERARYAPPDAMPSADACREAIESWSASV